MLILAFDTSGSGGSVAVLDGARLLAEQALDSGRRSAQTLAPAIGSLLPHCGLEPKSIQLVAATTGPGSFTGLRVGVATAKAFAYAVGAEVMGISTLEALAFAVSDEMLAGDDPEVHAIIDAQRGDLFVGRFQSEPGGSKRDELPRLTRLDADQIVSAPDWIAGLKAGTIVTGPAASRLEAQFPVGVVTAPPARREPSAAVIGRLAWRDYQAGRRDDLWKLAPVYLRPSYAEEKAGKVKRDQL